MGLLFDDEDVGLDAGWHLHGLPASVTLSTGAGNDDSTLELNELGDRIAQSIVSGTKERLIQDTPNKTSGMPENVKRTIQVPFVFQSAASGINERAVYEVLWYEREIRDIRIEHDQQCRDRVLLCFGAVDYQATVWVNGRFCGQHRGGHVPFDVDVTDALNCAPSQTANRVTVRVYDSAYDLTQPRGKQYWGAKPKGIFHTPSSGIWRFVWTEVVPRVRIADSSQGTVLRSDDIKQGILHATIGVLGRKAGEKLDVELKAWHKAQLVSTSARMALPEETSSVEIDLDMKFPGSSGEKQQGPSGGTSEKCNGSMLVWSPESPLLYELSIRLYNADGELVDLAETRVGVRSIEWSDGIWMLNGEPYFQALVLDQGYWPETLMTPPSADALRQDIELAKRMGFNGCRKHQKVEDPVFYHWADKASWFSGEYVERLNQEWAAAVKLVINHPSVVTWTPVNESWGYPALHDNAQQRNHIRALYHLTK
ncbi:hypothetical protein LLEC1_05961 [Akanthomyces lecanii]|uniref:Glycoside hydrolase family 2 immunoglobulin-like beta-sandwich domain-containing protein n=1 Tax=Cordyceps confragosa TaxID=2714763 RepID=A0A179I7K5_CORDF|nr:hypothetical protein LLEC1_05961 [Akanthomyces lecanii]